MNTYSCGIHNCNNMHNHMGVQIRNKLTDRSMHAKKDATAEAQLTNLIHMCWHRLMQGHPCAKKNNRAHTFLHRACTAGGLHFAIYIYICIYICTFKSVYYNSVILCFVTECQPWHYYTPNPKSMDVSRVLHKPPQPHTISMCVLHVCIYVCNNITHIYIHIHSRKHINNHRLCFIIPCQHTYTNLMNT